LRELVDPKIAEYRGPIVKNTDDGFLAEFVSVVDDVRCAVEVQLGMIDREWQTPDDERTKFLMGINLGDVIAEEYDIFGECEHRSALGSVRRARRDPMRSTMS
jgi:adenylate cyclase